MPSRIIFLQNMLAQKLCQRAGIPRSIAATIAKCSFDDWTILA
jgi:hypothetical protein